MNTTRNRIYRSLLQTIAGGGAANLLAEIAKLSGPWRGVVTAAGVLAFAIAQNVAEELGAIKDRRR